MIRSFLFYGMTLNIYHYFVSRLIIGLSLQPSEKAIHHGNNDRLDTLGKLSGSFYTPGVRCEAGSNR